MALLFNYVAVLSAFALAGLLSTSAVGASIARYDDWELICPATLDESAVAARKIVKAHRSGRCRLQQAQAIGGRDVVFLFNVMMQKGELVAIISTPLNVYLPAGLDLSIDGGRHRRATFESCGLTGCHAGFALRGSLLNGMRHGRTLAVTINNSKEERLAINVSLRGVTAGISALTRTRRDGASND